MSDPRVLIANPRAGDGERVPVARKLHIATLGPSGTSSEHAALWLVARVGKDRSSTVELFRSYEEAADAVLGREANRSIDI
jgi:hypothetical protein